MLHARGKTRRRERYRNKESDEEGKGKREKRDQKKGRNKREEREEKIVLKAVIATRMGSRLGYKKKNVLRTLPHPLPPHLAILSSIAVSKVSVATTVTVVSVPLLAVAPPTLKQLISKNRIKIYYSYY